VAVVPRVAVVGDRLHDNPVGAIVGTSVIVSVNPFRLVSVTVETPSALATACTVVGLAAIEKSCSMKVTETACERPPPLAVTVTAYTPAGPVQESDEEPLGDPLLREMLGGLCEHDRPEGETDEVSPTELVNS
jgi:hypothetical protein